VPTRWRRPIRRQGDGRFRIELTEPERDLIASAGQQLRELLFTDSPVIRRLFPTAYTEDPQADQAYRDRQGMALLDVRFRSLDVLDDTIRAEIVTEEQLTEWMQSINAVRLVIGTALDVDEHGEPSAADQDEQQQLLAYYEILGMLLMQIVHALRDSLPPGSRR
jgi:hypothetical protein